MPKNFPRLSAIRRKLTTSSRSLKFKCIARGRSVFDTAWKRNAANILPSAAPTAIDAMKKGIILVMPVMLIETVRAINVKVMNDRMKVGIEG